MSQPFSIGSAIHNLRREHGMTGEALAQKVGISQSRISRIETGALTNPKSDEIKKILNILEAPQSIQQQIMGALGMREALQVRRIKGSYTFEGALAELRRTNTLRVFTINLFPALLQTVNYQQAFLAHWDFPDSDLRTAMHTTQKRQDMLWDKRIRFHFIMHEMALYTTVGRNASQIEQLDRIDRFIGARNIKIGVVALESGSFPADLTAFAIYDERLLSKATAGVDILIRDRDDIAEHLKIFASLDRIADYGDSARALIRKAMDYFG